MAKITKDTTLAEILNIPGAEEVLTKYKVPCITCPFAKLEMERLKIGQVAGMYKINIENLLKELNEKEK